MAESNQGVLPESRPPSRWSRIQGLGKRLGLGRPKQYEPPNAPKEPATGENLTPDRGRLSLQEKSTQPEEITLGQLFDVFPPDKCEVNTYKDLLHVERRFALVTDVLPRLPMKFLASHAHMWRKGEVYLPFNPELGSSFNEAETNIDQRARKLISETQGADLDNNIVGLVFDARGLEEELFKLGVTKSPDSDTVKPELGPLVSRLRLQVYFPDSSFEGQPFDLELKRGSRTTSPSLYFDSFDPLEKQPSASAPPERPPKGFYSTPIQLLTAGKRICLPPELEKLGQIKARFVMVDELGRSPVPDVFKEALKE